MPLYDRDWDNTPDDTATANITEERAARRYHQMAATERQIQIKLADMTAAQQHVKELREEYEGLLKTLRSAARDEGELPLFADLD